MIEKRYRRYYLYGYLNNFNISKVFDNKAPKTSFVNQKIKQAFDHLGIRPPQGDFTQWAWAISFFEVFASFFIAFERFLIVSAQSFFTKKSYPKGLDLQAPQTWAAYRVKDMLKSLDNVNIGTIKIPFVKNTYKENEINVISVLCIKDIFDAFLSCIGMIFYMTHRFRKDDILFRSYSSFEYFLTCRFVKKTEKENHFIYYNTYDRWAFLMCHANSEVTFIQHGIMDDVAYQVKLIKVGTPLRAIYISQNQKKNVEDLLFESKPIFVGYRKTLEFTHNEVLNKSIDKSNVLIISASAFIDTVFKIVEILHNDVNLYVKPHPGEKWLDFYDEISRNFNVGILEKTDYPKVDVVISYRSTLADEYENAGIEVIRWDTIDNISKIKEIVLRKSRKKSLSE